MAIRMEMVLRASATLLLLISSCLAQAETLKDVRASHPDSCGLYLAPSRLLLGGLGIYAGRDLEPGSTVHVWDVYVPSIGETSSLGDDLAWDVAHGRALSELTNTLNRHATLHNVEPPTWETQSRSLEFMQIKVTAPVAAGDELLMCDDECAQKQSLITEEDVAEAERTLKKIQKEISDIAAETSTEFRSSLLRWFRSGLKDPIKSIFPETLEQLERATAEGSVRSSWLSQDLHRPVQWLAENGMCLDENIDASGTSSDLTADAERSAIATRALSKGSIVAPVPVHPVPFDVLIPSSSSDTDNGPPLNAMFNYCFGHEESSVMLCPVAGKATLVNHALGEKSANVRLGWSSKKLPQDNVRQLSVLNLLQQDPLVMLELVATRDIVAGEELLLDYGEAWEATWLNHQQQQQQDETAIKESTNVESATDWNGKNLAHIRTYVEQLSDPYPDNLYIGCHVDYDPSVTPTNKQEQGKVLYQTIPWTTQATVETTETRPCILLERTPPTTPDGSDTYSAFLHNHPAWDEHHPQFIAPEEKVVVMTDIPREHVEFVDQMVSTPQSTSSFRHAIRVPDGFFPEAWLDMQEPDWDAKYDMSEDDFRGDIVEDEHVNWGALDEEELEESGEDQDEPLSKREFEEQYGSDYEHTPDYKVSEA